MIQVERFKAEHAEVLTKLEKYAYLRPHYTPEHLADLACDENTYTGLVDGQPVFIGGVRQYWPGRGEAWALVHPECAKHPIKLHKVVKRFFDLCTVRRIEASVEVDFAIGRRWVEALGFKLEAERLEAYLPNGKDCALYARVKRG